MTTILLFLSLFVVTYILVAAFKYAPRIAVTTFFIIVGSTAIYREYGQTAVLLILSLSPVLYVVVSDLVGTLTSVKLSMPALSQSVEQQEATDLVEAAPLVGDWISGKTPKLSFQQVLIGDLDVKTLPRPWL